MNKVMKGALAGLLVAVTGPFGLVAIGIYLISQEPPRGSKTDPTSQSSRNHQIIRGTMRHAEVIIDEFEYEALNALVSKGVAASSDSKADARQIAEAHNWLIHTAHRLIASQELG